MSEESTTTATSSESESFSSEQEVETQSMSQAETTQDFEETSEQTEEAVDQSEEEIQTDGKLNIDQYIIKQIQGQELTAQDLQALEKAGLSLEHIEMIANGHIQTQLKNNEEIYESVGGKESYEQLKSFANEHLTEEEAEVLNSAFSGSNRKIAKLAALGLKAMADQMNGTQPKMRVASSGSNSFNSEGAYATQQDLIKDLNNKKYGKDPDFTRQVDNRRNKSGF